MVCSFRRTVYRKNVRASFATPEGTSVAQIAAAVVGHRNQWEQVKKIVSSDLQSGSFLFAGPEGIGKKKVAQSIAQYFLCENKNGCGLCGSCRRVESSTHESLLMIDEADDIIKMDEVHKIKEFLRLKALGSLRFIIINNAHRMNIPASNALLKTLEEPPEGVYFFLVSSRVSGLLVTIKSRCRLIPFSILTEEDLEKVSRLNDFSLTNFRKSGQLHLVSKSQDREFKSVVDLACEILDRIAERQFVPLSDAQKATIKSKDQFLDLIVYLEIFIRDILLSQAGFDPEANEVYFEEYRKDIQTWAQVSSVVWSQFYEILGTKKADLFLSPDANSFVESLIIENLRSVV
jgi:DNA polymerase III subunit delta'